MRGRNGGAIRCNSKAASEATRLFCEIVVIQIWRSETLWKLVRFHESHNNVMKVAERGLPQVFVAHFGFCNERPHDFNGLENECLNVGHAEVLE